MRLSHFSNLCFAAVLLAACASNSTSQAIKNAPKVAGNWQNLGMANQNNVIISYDAGSLRRNGALAWMRDRKIIVNPEKERYIGTPRYKVAVNDWEFNCLNRSYRITAAQFLDDKGRMIQQNRFVERDEVIPPQPILLGTVSEKQFNIACGK